MAPGIRILLVSALMMICFGQQESEVHTKMGYGDHCVRLDSSWGSAEYVVMLVASAVRKEALERATGAPLQNCRADDVKGFGVMRA